MGRRVALILLLAVLVVACCSCESSQTSSASGDGSRMSSASGSSGVYTRYNIHYCLRSRDNIASYANWTECGGTFLPYNSNVRVGSWRSGFSVTDVNTGMKILYEYHQGRMQMSLQDYLDLITSPTPVSYEGLSDVDRQGIQAGQAMVGMSKEGVTVALGYPAKHQTPSLDSNTWIYWKDRFRTLRVQFDGNGKVVSIM